MTHVWIPFDIPELLSYEKVEMKGSLLCRSGYWDYFKKSILTQLNPPTYYGKRPHDTFQKLLGHSKIGVNSSVLNETKQFVNNYIKYL